MKWQDGTFVETAEDAAEHLLKLLINETNYEDPNRDGLKKTPERFVKAFREMTQGYKQDPAEILSTVFDDDTYDEMVMVKNVGFKSLCEHHLLLFSGTVKVAYVPSVENRKIVGLSKLARLVDCFAQRLQVQERLTVQIADSIMQYLNAAGAGVVIEAHHSCMSCRGVKKDGATMVTSALRGCFMEQETRAEFLKL